MALIFEWDPKKAAANQRHGVPFEEASTVFADVLSITIRDQPHSNGQEERLVTIGLSSKNENSGGSPY